MKRLQISIPDQQDEMLHSESKRLGISIADIIRRLLTKEYGDQFQPQYNMIMAKCQDDEGEK